MSQDRSIVVEKHVAASPETVWEALTEAEELRRWFPLDARVEPGEGGTIWLSWGPGCEGQAPVHVWDPPRRVGWTEHGGSADAPVRLAVDFYVEPAEGGAVVRLIHSGFGPDADWDDYYDAVRDGWTYFMYNLVHYLEHHGGTPRRLAWVRRPAGRGREGVWQDLVGDAGPVPLPDGPVRVGARVPVRLGDAVRCEGIVIHGRADHCLAVRLPELDEALLFVELEMGGEGWHCGVWLSSWGVDDERAALLQEATDHLADEILA